MHARMLAGLALAVLGTVAQAAPMVTSCHGCTDYQARKRAEAQVPLDTRQTLFDVYVVNTPDRVLRRFLVEVSRREGFPTAFAWPEAPDPTWAREFAALADHWHAVSGLLKPTIELPVDGPARSVTEVFYSAVAEEAVSLELNRDIAAVVGAVVTSTLKLLPKVVWSARVYATVKFPDGSTGKFEVRNVEPMDGEGHVFRFEYVVGSARDSEGNEIPDRIEGFFAYAADFDDPYNYWLFHRQATIYGVRLREAAVHQKTTIVCVKTESEVVCWVRDQK